MFVRGRGKHDINNGGLVAGKSVSIVGAVQTSPPLSSDLVSSR